MKRIFQQLRTNLRHAFYDFFPHDHVPHRPIDTYTRMRLYLGTDYYQPLSYCTKCRREITYFHYAQTWGLFKTGLKVDPIVIGSKDHNA